MTVVVVADTANSSTNSAAAAVIIVIVVAAAAVTAAVILNAHEPHKLGGHLAIRVLGEVCIAPLVCRVLVLLGAPDQLALLLLFRIAIGIDNSRIIVFGQL